MEGWRLLGYGGMVEHEYREILERARFPSDLDVDMLARISRELRKDRELAFYGAEDLIPTEACDRADAETAIRSAELVVEAARRVIGGHRSD
jgi:HEPN domain-containing protein